jgi:glycosyltransferase involved in cell wall biosynthesis
MFKQLNVLAIVSHLVEEKKGIGGITNERQLLFALRNYVNKIYVSCIVSPGLNKKLQNKFIVMPVPKLTSVFLALLHSPLFAFVALVLRVLNRVDVVYIRNAPAALIPLVFKKFIGPVAVKIPGFALDSTPPNSSFITKLTSFVGSLIENYVVHRCDLICVHSNLMAERLAEKYRVAVKKCVVISPGINVDEINRVRKTSRGRLLDDIRVGYLGTFNYWQGVDILVQAMEEVHEDFPNASLWMIGDGDTLGDVKALLEKSTFNFVSLGVVPHNEALKILSTFDMLVLPRRRNIVTESNLPMKVIEALALGVPVIVTGHNIIQQNFKDGLDVIYTEPSPKDVSEKIINLLTDNVLADKLHTRGPQLAKRFDYDNFAEILWRSLLNLCDPHS